MDIKSAFTGDNPALSNHLNATTTAKVWYPNTTQIHYHNNPKTATTTLRKQHETTHQVTQPETVYNTLTAQLRSRSRSTTDLQNSEETHQVNQQPSNNKETENKMENGREEKQENEQITGANFSLSNQNLTPTDKMATQIAMTKSNTNTRTTDMYVY